MQTSRRNETTAIPKNQTIVAIRAPADASSLFHPSAVPVISEHAANEPFGSIVRRLTAAKAATASRPVPCISASLCVCEYPLHQDR
jgi:hypothetical protein